MKTIESKSFIEENRKIITSLLSGSTVKRLNNFNWIRHEFSKETEVLFQLPAHLQKNLYLDFNSIRNTGSAWDYIIKNQNIKIIDDFEIRKVHSILSQDTDIPGGAYRKSDAYSEKLGINAPRPNTIIYHMDNIKYQLSDNRTEPLIKAFNVHYDLIALQTFEDFNKRTARMIMNWVLIQNGYRPILFNQKSDKVEYMAALYARAHDDPKTYLKYMYTCMLRTQNSLINMLQRSHIG